MAIPKVTKDSDANERKFASVPDSEYSGEYVNIHDGLIYAKAIQKDCQYKKTHKAKNSAGFWEGTEAQFNSEFRKA